MDDAASRPLAIVTGASTGIGYELAKCCAREGYDLLVAADEGEIERAAMELRELGVAIADVQADVIAQEAVLALDRGRPLDDADLGDLGEGDLGRAALMEGAEDLAQRLAPALRAVRSEGANTLRGMADALNRRGIKSSRGGVWHPSSVANLLSRVTGLL